MIETTRLCYARAGARLFVFSLALVGAACEARQWSNDHLCARETSAE
jgi:hypothetical protein